MAKVKKDQKKQLRRILIANRGEVALRVVSTCRQLGIETVVLYAHGEEALPHTMAGDAAFCLGEGPLKDTYLNEDLIVEVAQKFGADAIHPGYGFLSERASFARKVEKAGLVFIGPKADVIELMGDKKASKEKVGEIGAPMVPGYHGNEQDGKKLLNEAKKIGFPVLIKATAGGGGKGMRIVNEEKDFLEELELAKSEAKKAFGDDRVLLEKYILRPRHIEVQVFSDSHGHHLHLWERECSIQRRHQKIVEESPSPGLTPELRRKITQAAVDVAREVGYLGAGTVEFVLDQAGNFYFLEMNTRLQVEHPVTEMVTGLDLVKWQILVAQGEALPLSQEDIRQYGHAIEVRLYAEDPDQNFMPTIGKIVHRGLPSLSWVRLDSGYETGNEVGIHYDPMLAKLIAWGRTREEAISRLLVGLDDVPFLGLKTNRDYLKRVLKHRAFMQGLTFTDFVQVHKEDLGPQELSDETLAWMVAGLVLGGEKVVTGTHEAQKTFSPWDNLGSLRNC